MTTHAIISIFSFNTSTSAIYVLHICLSGDVGYFLHTQDTACRKAP